MSSFNLAALISKKSVPIVKDQSVKKTFTHGINVIFIDGIYKGYHGIVNDFFPATYDLEMVGEAYIDVTGPIEPVGSVIYTKYGESLIKKIIKNDDGTLQKIIKLVVYNDNGKIKVGVVLDEINNNVTIFEIQIENIQDTQDVSEKLKGMSIGDNTGDLVLKLNDMNISMNVKTILKKLEQKLERDGLLVNKLSNIKKGDSDQNEKVIYKKDIVGIPYFMNLSFLKKENKDFDDIFKQYDSNKYQYYISYNQKIRMKADNLIIQKDRVHAKIKSGNFKEQVLKIKSYNKARLSVILATNGKKIENHAAQVVDNDGNPVLKFEKIQFKLRPIYQSDVFYLDLTLKNGNKAQLVKIIDETNLSIVEKVANNFVEKKIMYADIEAYEPGFSFSTQNQQNQKDDTPEDMPEDTSAEIQLEQVYDEDPDEKEQDYNDDKNEENGVNIELNDLDEVEDNFKVSFKDTERSSYEQVNLTSMQARYKKEVLNILKRLNINEDTIDVLNTINTVESIISVIVPQVKKEIGYNNDFNVTSNLKFVIICIVMYELAQANSSYSPGFDKVIDRLFPTKGTSYLTIKDISASNMNDIIFLKEWNKLDNKMIKESIDKIKLAKEKEDYKTIFKIILINTDIVLQNILHTNIDINNKFYVKDEDLVPLGVNKLTGLRYKDEKVVSLKNAYKQFGIHVKDILGNKIPEKEVPIIWGNEQKILDKYKMALQDKFDNSNKDADYTSYIYIKDNLHRAPFALRDIMPIHARKYFESTYRNLLGTIVEWRLKLERKKRKLENNNNTITENRKNIKRQTVDSDSEDESSFDVAKNTASYEKKRKLMDMEKSLKKASVASNKAFYQAKNKKENK